MKEEEKVNKRRHGDTKERHRCKYEENRTIERETNERTKRQGRSGIAQSV